MRNCKVCLFLLAALCCSVSLARSSSEEQRKWGDEVRQQLLERGPLAPFAPHSAGGSLSSTDLQDIVREFAKTKRQASGVPESMSPLVIVPSLIGSKLQAQLNSYQSAHWYCWTEWKDWFTIWANFEEFLPVLINCFFEQFALHLDQTSGRSYDTPGVSIRTVDYGGVTGVTYLDDSHTVGIWNTTVSILEALGWQVGKNLRSGPYDWRYGPEKYAEDDWPRLRALIEDTYATNNNTKVVVTSLSMGGPYFLGFLNQQSQEWKDKYLRSYVSLDGAFGGSPSAIAALTTLSGWWASKFSDPAAMRNLVQSWPSIVWMLPLAQLYGSDYVWVTTRSPPRNYTTADLGQLLADATGYNASKVFHLLQTQKWFTFDAPGVESHAIFGTGVPTPLRSTYNTTAFDTAPITQFGNGDGVVPEAGLRLLEIWRGKQAHPIYSYPIQGLAHGGSVQNKVALRLFVEILTSQLSA